jgi:hypothetical protein
MRFILWTFLLGLFLLISSPAVAQAGMPSLTLTDVARMRVQTISFFLVGLLVTAASIQLIWNYLRRDFTILPRLTYKKALGLVSLWGLLFVLVLTMISGARELMTPGAWEKHGATYRLADRSTPGQNEKEKSFEKERKSKLEQLKQALWKYADSHSGRFPDVRTVAAIAPEKWQAPHPSGMRYLYVPGLVVGKDATPLAYEPEVFGTIRLVLLSSGEIRWMDSAELSNALPAEKS